MSQQAKWTPEQSEMLKLDQRDCGCYFDAEDCTIQYCLKHTAAPELVEALCDLLIAADVITIGGKVDDMEPRMQKAQAALRKAGAL